MFFVNLGFSSSKKQKIGQKTEDRFFLSDTWLVQWKLRKTLNYDVLEEPGSTTSRKEESFISYSRYLMLILLKNWREKTDLVLFGFAWEIWIAGFEFFDIIADFVVELSVKITGFTCLGLGLKERKTNQKKSLEPVYLPNPESIATI